MTLPLEHWDLQDALTTPIDVGLINQTYAVTNGEARYILQRLNPIFGHEVHTDIRAVTEHLRTKGLVTPQLVAAKSGADFVVDDDDVWRLMTWVDGRTLTKLDAPSQAKAAGDLLGRFHDACTDLEHEFVHVRVGVHDTDQHLAGLKSALQANQGHPFHDETSILAQSIFQMFETLPDLHLDIERVVHGDPKISNLIFKTQKDEALCLVDLDTLGRMPLALEMGDAFRSWCNAANEDADTPHFDAEYFGAALEGWAPRVSTWILAEERDALPFAAAVIATELAARFARDTLEEGYFGWDRARYGRAAEHNLARAQSQFALAVSAQKQAAELRMLVDRAFG